MTRGEFRLVAGATTADESSPVPIEAAVLRHLQRVGFDGAPIAVPASRHAGRDGPPPADSRPAARHHREADGPPPAAHHRVGAGPPAAAHHRVGAGPPPAAHHGVGAGPLPADSWPAGPGPGEGAGLLLVEECSERALRAMARLLRRFHDAVASFPGPYSRLPYGLGGVAPCDVVFVDGLPRRLARMPALAPMPRVADVALTLLHWAPVRDGAARAAAQRALDPGPRLAGFCDAYGLGAQPRRALLPVIREHLRVSGDATALAWLDTHWDRLDSHLR